MILLKAILEKVKPKRCSFCFRRSKGFEDFREWYQAADEEKVGCPECWEKADWNLLKCSDGCFAPVYVSGNAAK